MAGTVGRGRAWLGMAGPGVAWQEWPGGARHGSEWRGKEWQDWHGMARQGPAGPGTAGLVRLGFVRIG